MQLLLIILETKSSFFATFLTLSQYIPSRRSKKIRKSLK